MDDFAGARDCDDDQDLIFAHSLRIASARASAFSNWRNAEGELLILACAIARQREMNAVAGRQAQVHCLSVFDPLIGAFFDFFTAILSIPTFLPDFGDAEKEDISRLTQRKATLGFGYLAAAEEPSGDPQERGHAREGSQERGFE